MKKIIVALADGFEEIEAVTVIDVLRRANIETVVVSLDSLEVKGAHQLNIKADKLINEIEFKEVEGIVLPGGMPGAKNLKNNGQILKLVKYLAENNHLIAAICAAPIVLAQAGIINNKQITSYPGFEDQLDAANYLTERVVRDQNLITARGPGVALEFALEIVNYLTDEMKVKELKKAMLTNF